MAAISVKELQEAIKIGDSMAHVLMLFVTDHDKERAPSDEMLANAASLAYQWRELRRVDDKASEG